MHINTYIFIHIHALCKKYIYADTQILLGSHLNGLQLYESLLLYRDIYVICENKTYRPN